ncbi:hypothetical protein EES37_12760 [Streptomyces sp. ADI91-18]|nr:hypothetical protein EES37_12760 [Streptomyces sp. ADI91-18]
MARQYWKARSSTGPLTPSDRCPLTFATRRSRAASSSTCRTIVPGWPQSSSALRSAYASRTISPAVAQPAGSPKRPTSAAGPPYEFGAYGRAAADASKRIAPSFAYEETCERARFGGSCA